MTPCPRQRTSPRPPGGNCPLPLRRTAAPVRRRPARSSPRRWASCSAVAPSALVGAAPACATAATSSSRSARTAPRAANLTWKVDGHPVEEAADVAGDGSPRPARTSAPSRCGRRPRAVGCNTPPTPASSPTADAHRHDHPPRRGHRDGAGRRGAAAGTRPARGRRRGGAGGRPGRRRFALRAPTVATTPPQATTPGEGAAGDGTATLTGRRARLVWVAVAVVAPLSAGLRRVAPRARVGHRRGRGGHAPPPDQDVRPVTPGTNRERPKETRP